MAPTHISRDDRGVSLRPVTTQEWQQHEEDVDMPLASSQEMEVSQGKKSSPVETEEACGSRWSEVGVVGVELVEGSPQPAFVGLIFVCRRKWPFALHGRFGGA